MRKTIRTYQGFILPTLIYAASALVIYYGIIPGIKAVQRYYDESNRLAKDVVAIKKHVNVLQALDDDVLQRQVDILVAAVPTDKSLGTVLSTIDTAASQVGATLIGLIIKAPGSIATGSALPAAKVDPKLSQNTILSEINVNGTPEQINQFLDTLVKIRRLVRVSQANISYGEENVVKTTLTVEGFYSILPEVLSKPTDEIVLLTAKQEDLIARLEAYPVIGQDFGPIQLVPGDKTDPFSIDDSGNVTGGVVGFDQLGTAQ